MRVSGLIRGRSVPRAKRRRHRLFDHLESRIVPTTTVFLDFGLGLPAAGLDMTVPAIRNIDGTNTGPDLRGFGMPNTLQDTHTVRFSRLNHDWDGDGDTDDADIEALRDAVLLIARRELAPFDVDVRVAAAGSDADIQARLHDNDPGGPTANAFGENDAYVLIATAMTTAFDGATMQSVGTVTSLAGIAAGADLFAQMGNDVDELALTFADAVLASTVATGGLNINARLAFRIAYTAVHEAAHTFTLRHTAGDAPNTADQRALSSGDAIRFGSTTRETNNIVTRFVLPLRAAENPGLTNDNYTTLATDMDIAPADADRDGVPDFAYVTGTGAHDRITLTNAGGGGVNVQVQAFREAAMINQIGLANYNFTLHTDTEGLIVVDSSVGDDEVVVNADIAASFLIRGGDGADEVILRGSATNAITAFTFKGEGGNDLLTIDLAAGNQVSGIDVDGGPGDDVLNGGTGVDTVTVEADDVGGDTIVVNAAGTQSTGVGTDMLAGFERMLLLGSPGNDTLTNNSSLPATLNGGAGSDVLTGGLGTDQVTIEADNVADTIVVNAAGNQSTGAGTDTLTRIERVLLLGSVGNDTLTNNSSLPATLNGRAGDDLLTGGLGTDQATIEGDDVGDTIVVNAAGTQSTGVGTDTLIRIERILLLGGDGNDTLTNNSTLPARRGR
jgi:hypothetical protein